MAKKTVTTPLTEREKFWLTQDRKEPVCDVLEIRPGMTPDGDMVFSLVNDKWRNAAIERKRFERIAQRDAVCGKGRETL